MQCQQRPQTREYEIRAKKRLTLYSPNEYTTSDAMIIIKPFCGCQRDAPGIIDAIAQKDLLLPIRRICASSAFHACLFNVKKHRLHDEIAAAVV